MVQSEENGVRAATGRFRWCSRVVPVLIAAAVVVAVPSTAVGNELATPPAGSPVAVWTGATDASPSGSQCTDYMFPVSISAGTAVDQKVFGRLCGLGSAAGKPIQVLVHGGSYNHTYWDFPYQPDTYSYVRSATQAGNVTLALDLLGYGHSSHPLGTLLTFDTEAWVVHQIIQYVRQGQLGVGFSKVVLVGHSMGSLTSWVEAARYRDIDGLISTGAEHTINLTTVATKVLTMLTEPAGIDPKFASDGLVDYTTSWPGIRKDAFYYQPGTAPGIYAVDEATKDTIPAGQWADMLVPLQETYLTKTIDVPVLIADGDYDTFYCTTTCSTPGSAAQEEVNNFSSSNCLELYILPNAGHDVNLEKTAPLWYQKAKDWATKCHLN